MSLILPVVPILEEEDAEKAYYTERAYYATKPKPEPYIDLSYKDIHYFTGCSNDRRLCHEVEEKWLVTNKEPMRKKLKYKFYPTIKDCKKNLWSDQMHCITEHILKHKDELICKIKVYKRAEDFSVNKEECKKYI